LSELVIRPARLTDLPGILSLYAQPDMDDGDVLSLEEAETIFARMCSYPDYTLIVAVDERGIAGSLALLIMDNLAHRGARSAIVEDVVVDPSRQDSGIGTALVRDAMARARAKRCYKLVLSSNAKRTRAHAFYDRLGFQRHGVSFWVDLPPPAMTAEEGR
jgi:ribosomal protein S18 acetylase RimI-like enzyme